MISGINKIDQGKTRLLLAAAALALLAGCQGSDFSLFNKTPPAEDGEPARAVKLIEHDVEAPDVFQVTEAGLWDGRPSLGGVWVAHPDVIEPERVIIRNTTNGKFVIGALFRRERENPGPRLQVSSDAAATLGVLAGQPVRLNVTALRREQVAEEPAAPPPSEAQVPPASSIEEKPLDPVKSAEKAIEKAEAKAAPAAPAPAPKPAKPSKSKLEKPFIQIGIFSVRTNAEAAAKNLNGAGVKTDVIEGNSKGKAFWRVVAGPAKSASDRTELLKKIKARGFADAYAVTN
ncbi:SPOR domain-containing protein [Thalassobius vesicularis]|uniref:SPOR domain-containing protein n=1 Tax=Thalassobius vesicularis TaxID=1294297 RepID=A0A4S3MBW3_9RHOB|nr:SPOR domain-containing protein [Thalassobius vesicularis]